MKHQAKTAEQEKKIRLKQQAQEREQSKRGGSDGQLGADRALLQNRLGNSGVSRMLAPSEQNGVDSLGGIDQIMNRPLGSASAIQREPLPDDPKARQAAIRKRIAAGQKRRKEQKAADNGWFGKNTKLGKAAGWFGFNKSEGDKDDDDAGSKIDYDGAKFSGEHEEDPGFVKEKEFGSWDQEAMDKEEEEEAKDEAEIFSIKKININLAEADGKTEGKLGEASGKTGAKGNVEGLEGEAEVEWQFGKGGKLVRDSFPWDIENNVLSTKTESAIEGFIGAKAEGNAKANFNRDDYSAAAKGKISAFAGGTVESKTEVSISMGGKDAVKTSGTLGATWGVGGEFEFKVAWSGGSFTVGGKAKASAGLGFSAGYEVEINTKSIASTLWSWFSSLSEGLSDEDMEAMWV